MDVVVPRFIQGWVMPQFGGDEVNRRRSNSGTGCDLVSQFMDG